MSKHLETQNYQRTKSLFVLSVLCLSLPILGGCAAAGIASALGNGSSPSAASTGAVLGADSLISSPTASSGTTLLHIGGDSYINLSYNSDDGVITSLSSPSYRPVSVSLSYGQGGVVTSLSYSTPDGTTSFSSGQIQNFGSGYSGENGSVVFSAITQEYSSFGVWADDPASTSTATVGVFAGGVAATQVPVTGSASYTGAFVGFYVSSSGIGSGTYGQISSEVDFSSRTGTISAPTIFLTESGVTRSDLGFSGSFDFGASGSNITGSVIDRRGAAGTVQGAFFGPGASEAGGRFVIRGAGIDTHLGAFGMSRP